MEDSAGATGAGKPDDRLPDAGLQDDDLPAALHEAFDHLSRLRFDEYMELALYAPASGFFATDGGAGRRTGDFITSPEVGPLFGAVVASRLDRLWDDLGRPSEFTVLEAGAGRGALAIAVRATEPRCAASLHWVMVERSASLRALQAEHLDLVDGRAGLDGQGPWFSSEADMPSGPFTGAVVANELLDNLPFRLMECTGPGWAEVCVERMAAGTDRGGSDGGSGALREVLAETDAFVGRRLGELVPQAPVGRRVPWQGAAAAWVERARSVLDAGAVIVFDYGRSTAELAYAGQSAWLRTYRGHVRGQDPYETPGSRDITTDVATDQLPEPTQNLSQSEWLERNGMGALVEEARAVWSEQAARGGLEAVRARSVPTEAAALADPEGLGGFVVMEWQRL